MISVLQTVYQTNNDSPIIRVGDSCTDVIIFMCYSFSKKFFGYSVRIPAQQACEERNMAIDKVREFFAGTELEGKIMEADESSATVELAAHAFHTEPDRIAKSLSFLQDETPVLVIASGLSRVDNRKYKDQFKMKAKMIPFEEVEGYIGHAPGGVCPFAVNEGVKVYLDVSLKKYETVFPAAGNSNSAIEMTIPQMERYTGSLGWIDVCK